MRRALLIGIDNYPPPNTLNGCVADVIMLRDALLANGDGTQNFEIETLLDEPSGRVAMGQIESLFAGDHEIALLYFSGHGCESSTGSEIVFPLEACSGGYYKGLQMRSIMDIVNRSPAKNKVIILDCCHAGDFGRYSIDIDNSDLRPGVTILSACKGDEEAKINPIAGHSVFTEALCMALNGAAADYLGNITIGSLYAYIDRFFTATEQRPVFKTNATEFVPIRKMAPKVPVGIINDLVNLFPKENEVLPLDPSYEETNTPDKVQGLKDPQAEASNVEVMKKLQELVRIGFVEPVGTNYMYYAAMNSTGCRLTELGKYYWHLVSKKPFEIYAVTDDFAQYGVQ